MLSPHEGPDCLSHPAPCFASPTSRLSQWGQTPAKKGGRVSHCGLMPAPLGNSQEHIWYLNADTAKCWRDGAGTNRTPRIPLCSPSSCLSPISWLLFAPDAGREQDFSAETGTYTHPYTRTCLWNSHREGFRTLILAELPLWLACLLPGLNETPVRDQTLPSKAPDKRCQRDV